MNKGVLVLVAMMTLLLGCNPQEEQTGPRVLAGTCGFPKRLRDGPTTGLPQQFIFDGVEVANFEDRKARTTAALNVPMGVQDALARYRAASTKAGFEIIQEDNEGFEAELYLRKGPDLAAIQIRGSTCQDAVRVYVNIVKDAATTLPG